MHQEKRSCDREIVRTHHWSRTSSYGLQFGEDRWDSCWCNWRRVGGWVSHSCIVHWWRTISGHLDERAETLRLLVFGEHCCVHFPFDLNREIYRWDLVTYLVMFVSSYPVLNGRSDRSRSVVRLPSPHRSPSPPIVKKSRSQSKCRRKHLFSLKIS